VASRVTVELSRRAERDLRSLSRPDRRRIGQAIPDVLARDPLPENADDKPLAGAAPWRRLRVGELRVVYRLQPGGGRLIAWVIQRGDLDRAVRTLPPVAV